MKAREEAIISGERHYGGKPCKTCGETKRHTLNAGCVKCSNERSRIYARKRRKYIQSMLNKTNEVA